MVAINISSVPPPPRVTPAARIATGGQLLLLLLLRLAPPPGPAAAAIDARATDVRARRPAERIMNYGLFFKTSYIFL